MRQVDFNNKISYSKVISLSRSEFQDVLVNIYPNPSSEDNIKIAVKGNNKIVNISAYNYLGHSSNISLDYSRDGLINMNVSELLSGTYIIKLEFTDGQILYKKLIIR